MIARIAGSLAGISVALLGLIVAWSQCAHWMSLPSDIAVVAGAGGFFLLAGLIVFLLVEWLGWLWPSPSPEKK